MRLHSITLKNFRLFRNETFELKPLTILTGPNSSGKSTVVKALMLLQENLQAPNYLGRLTFKSGNHRLGNFESILTRGIKESIVTFELRFENTSFKRDTEDKRHRFEDVTFFRVVYTFDQHSAQQSENGLLKLYEIHIQENEDPERLILSCGKNEDTSSNCFFINGDWLINKIFDTELFKFSPKLHLIWDKIMLHDFDREIARRKQGINKRKKTELANLKKGKIIEKEANEAMQNIFSRIKEINKILKLLGSDKKDGIYTELETIEEKKEKTKKRYDLKLEILGKKIQQKENQATKLHLKIDGINKKNEILREKTEKSIETSLVLKKEIEFNKSIEKILILEKGIDFNEVKQKVTDKRSLLKEELTEEEGRKLEKEKEIYDELKKRLNRGENIEDVIEGIIQDRIKLEENLNKVEEGRKLEKELRKTIEYTHTLEIKKELEEVIVKTNLLEKEKVHLEESKKNLLNVLEQKKQVYETKHISTEEQEKKLDSEKADLKSQLDTIIQGYRDDIIKKFEKEAEEVRESEIRTLLYEQIKAASETYLKSLITLPFNGNMPDLRGSTISDYLAKTAWESNISAITQAKEGLKISEALTWTDETLFIKDIIEQKRSSITGKEDVRLFSKLIGESNENQLTQLLVSNIQQIINTFHSELPFTSISAMRGFQQRLYQTANPDFHLEEALSTLLTMQYQDTSDKLDFIQKWIKAFGIGEEIEAQVIEGDYVKGIIKDENKGEMNIADKGLGIAQLIPIIIHTADAIGTNRLICIEEPGTHLHPDLQAKLVEFVQDAVSLKVQFLLESHSEYFIRKLQYQVINNPEFSPSDVLIRYLNSQKGENKTIFIDSTGELIDEKGFVIENFGDGFLDEATKWVNKQKLEKEIRKSVSEQTIQEFLDNGRKVIFCENLNALHYNALNLPHIYFFSVNDKFSVYLNTIKFPECYGIIDRDYITDEEIKKIQEKHTNLFILNYYCFENYLYHPDNIIECLKEIPSNYKENICLEKSKQKLLLFTKIVSSRQSYDLLKHSRGIFESKNDDQAKKGSVLIMQYLEDDEFEIFYKVFSMKDNCGTIRGILNAKPEKLAGTAWFKKKIIQILHPIFVETNELVSDK